MLPYSMVVVRVWKWNFLGLEGRVYAAGSDPSDIYSLAWSALQASAACRPALPPLIHLFLFLSHTHLPSLHQLLYIMHTGTS